MKRITGVEDQMRGIEVFEFPDGRRVNFSAREVERYGIEELLKYIGVKPADAFGTERVPVFWCGRIVGTMDPTFDPLFAKSKTWLYDIRPGDFRRTDRGWEADKMLGPGDLDAVPGFVWEPEQTANVQADGNQGAQRNEK